MKKIKSIFLHGFRGTGKTTIAKILAERLGFDHIEMDDLIVSKTGQTIDQLTNGGTNWQKFRLLEHLMFIRLLGRKNIVVSTGGGLAVNNIVKDNTNKTFGELNLNLLQNAQCVLSIVLTADDKIICQRLYKQEFEKTDVKRPLLDEKRAERLTILLEKYNSDIQKRKKIIVNEIVKDSLKIFRSRKPLYKKISKYIIDTGKLTIAETVDEIIKIIQKNTV